MKIGYRLRTLAFIAGFVVIAPLAALVLKTPWGHLLSNLSDLSAVKLSLWTSLLATLFALLLGVPLAWVLAKSSKNIVGVIRPLILAPIVLPPTVAGLALLALFGRSGVLGKPLYDLTGITLPFTSVAVVLSGLFVALPFVVLICESSFRNLPREIEDAAVIDRVSGGELFAKIVIPQSINTIITAGLLAWARAIGEFGATLMFAGSFPNSTQTWPMYIYQQLDVDVESAYSYAILMLLVAISIVFILRKQLRATFR